MNGNDDFMKMYLIFHSHEIHPTSTYNVHKEIKCYLSFLFCYVLFRERHLPHIPTIIQIRCFIKRMKEMGGEKKLNKMPTAMVIIIIIINVRTAHCAPN